MDQQALLFGPFVRPGFQPGEACRVEFDLIGAGAGGVDEGLDINVHAFALGQIPLQLAPKSPFRIWQSGDGAAAGLARSEIGVPDCFIFLTQDHSVIT